MKTSFHVFDYKDNRLLSEKAADNLHKHFASYIRESPFLDDPFPTDLKLAAAGVLDINNCHPHLIINISFYESNRRLAKAILEKQ